MHSKSSDKDRDNEEKDTDKDKERTIVFRLPSFGEYIRQFQDISHFRTDNEAISITHTSKNKSLPLLKGYVARIQSNCSVPVSFIRAHPFGYGSMINYGMLAAVKAWGRGFRVSFVPDDFEDEAKQYYDETICKTKEKKKNVLACYFRPLSQCDDKAAYEVLAKAADSRKHVLPMDNMRSMREETEAQQKFQELVPTPWFWKDVYSILYQPSASLAVAVAAQEKVYTSMATAALLNNTARVQPARLQAQQEQAGGSGKAALGAALNISTTSFVCVHMRGDEKHAEMTSVLDPSEYATQALRFIRHQTHPEYILLISEDEERMKAFNKYVQRHNSSVSIVALNPVSRKDSRKFLHVTQIVAVMNYCSRARAVLVTISSNIGRVILYQHLLNKPGLLAAGHNSTFSSIDLFLMHQHASISESIPMISVSKPPFYPT